MNSFRTIELSDAPYESGGLRFMTIKTPHLKGRGDLCLFVPTISEPLSNLPIYILLHGVYGSAWIWALKGGAHHTAKRLMEEGTIRPAIIAMPSDGLWGDGSGYLSHEEKNYEAWITTDVPKAIRENIPNADETSPLCIGGLSMGGYGALHLGAKYSHKFRAIAAHSSITKFSEMASFVEEPLNTYPLNTKDVDVIDIIKKQEAHLPPIRFDCGTSDELLAGNQRLHRELEEIGIPHIYEEFEGGHEWAYWQKHLSRTLCFFDKNVNSLSF